VDVPGVDASGLARGEEEIKLVQRVFLAPGPATCRAVLFAEVERHGDSAAICARSAEILAAQVGGAVCVVDADLRKPSLHHRFGIEVVSGVSDGLRDGDHARGFTHVTDNLWLLPAGPPVAEPHVLLAPDRLRHLFKRLREQFDYVLISAPPFEAAETIHLSQLTDGAILVVKAHATRREHARKVKESLAAGQVPLLGVILNNRRFPIPESIYRRL
jgi:Mrp family chromosome partitioning ATPase